MLYPLPSYSDIAASLFFNTVSVANSHLNASDASASASCRSRDAIPIRRCDFFTSTLERNSASPSAAAPGLKTRLTFDFFTQHVTHPTASPPVPVFSSAPRVTTILVLPDPAVGSSTRTRYPSGIFGAM